MRTRLHGTESERRLVRAEAAATLLRLHEAGSLGEPERWTWDVLDRLPLWCLLDETRRRRLQLCAGAVLLGPELRLWLERERLERVAGIVGRSMLRRVLHEADALAASVPATGGGSADGPADGSAAEGRTGTPGRRPRATIDPDADAAALEAWLASCGTAVLLGSLDADLPLGGLVESLGESAGRLPPDTARALLAHAERLLVDEAAGAAEADAAARTAAKAGPGAPSGADAPDGAGGELAA